MLRFDPIPYDNPEPTGAQYAQQWGQGINQLGQTIGHNRELEEQAKRQELQDRILGYGLQDKYGSVGARKILRPTAPPRKILAQSSQVNLGQPMTAPADAPMESFDMTDPGQMMQARSLYGSSGVQPYVDAQDTALDRRYKESQIGKNDAEAFKDRQTKPSNRTFIGNGVDGKPLFADKEGNISVGEVPGGGPIYPKNLTDSQTTAAGYGDRAEDANRILDTLFRGGKLNPGNVGFAVADNKHTPNFAKPAAYQQFDQAKRNFHNAILRRESGAVINPSEFEETDKQYFPQYGDSPEVLAQKAQGRIQAIANLRRSAGPAGMGRQAPQVNGQPEPDVSAYAQKHGISYEQAAQIKRQRMGGQ